MPFEEKEFQLVLSGTGGTNIDTKIDTKGVMINFQSINRLFSHFLFTVRPTSKDLCFWIQMTGHVVGTTEQI